MDMIINASVYNMFCLVNVPGIAYRISGRQRRLPGCVRQVIVIPISIEPELMNVVICSAVYYMFGIVHTPGVGARIRSGGGIGVSGGVGKIIMAPFSVEPQFVNMIVGPINDVFRLVY